MNRIVGLVVAAAGAAVLWFGWEEKQSIGSQIGQLVGSGPSDRALWLLIAGAVLVVVGLAYASGGRRIGGRRR